MDKTNYRYNNNINDINFRYILESKKKHSTIHKSIKVNYYKMLNILEFNNKCDDLGVNYNKGTTRQIQYIMHLLLKCDEVIKCNVYVNDQIIL